MISILKIVLILLILLTCCNSEAQWTQTNGPYGGIITSFAKSGNNIYGGVFEDGVYLSTDNGLNWNKTAFGIRQVTALATIGSTLLAGTRGSGLYRSTDNGQNWTLTSINNYWVSSLTVIGSTVYAGAGLAGSIPRGLYKSTDEGLTWNLTSLTGAQVYCITKINNNDLFTGTDLGVFFSSNSGQNWTHILSSVFNIYTIAYNLPYIFAGTDNEGYYYSTNYGTNWQIGQQNYWTYRDLIVIDTKILGATSEGVYCSTNNGFNWTLVSPVLQYNKFLKSGTEIFAGSSSDGIYISVNNGSNWSKSSNGIRGEYIMSISASQRNSIIYNNTNGLISGGSAVFITSNNGNNWSQTSLLPHNGVKSTAVNGEIIYAGTFRHIYISTDYGINWETTSFNQVTDINSLAFGKNKVFAGVEWGLYYTTNNGQNWIRDYSISGNVSFICAKNGTDSNKIFLCSYSGIYMSTNDGNNWTLLSLNNNHVLSLAVRDSTLFAGTEYYGIYRSLDNGQTWDTVFNNTYYKVNALFIEGQNIIAGMDILTGMIDTIGGILVSTNNGENWFSGNNGLDTSNVLSLAVTNGYVFAGITGGSVWKRLLSELISINIISKNVPVKFILYQNYPNPFNPSTKIKFDIGTPLNPPFDKGGTAHSAGGLTKLIIYDVLGKEIATLVNEELKPGTYEVEWNAVNYPSGIYFYTLQAGDVMFTRKMILLK
ncbi:MAG: T9SS C-terminal target domain-containing protein [Ignavibacteriae bacterium]|nr:MAG: T9SS C-terminal target domain-containing protein [Ignavibacteriota bacterium]